VIYKEIKKRDELKFGRQMQEKVLLHLQKQLVNCSRNRKENMRLETLRKWLQEAKTQVFFRLSEASLRAARRSSSAQE